MREISVGEEALLLTKQNLESGRGRRGRELNQCEPRTKARSKFGLKAYKIRQTLASLWHRNSVGQAIEPQGLSLRCPTPLGMGLGLLGAEMNCYHCSHTQLCHCLCLCDLG